MVFAIVASVAIASASLVPSHVHADGPTDHDLRVLAQAKSLKERDVEKAQKSVEHFEELVKSSVRLKDVDGAARARVQLRSAKIKLNAAKGRRVESYYDISRLMVREIVEHERVQELNRVEQEERKAKEKLAKQSREDGIRASQEQNERRRQEDLAEKRKVGPIFIDSAVVATNAIGLPEVNFAATNTSDVAIEGFELEIKCLNSFDEPVVSMAGKNTVVASVAGRVAAGKQSLGSIQLSLHRATAKALVRVTRVKLANGDVWSQTAEEAATVQGAVFTALTPR
jgi:hypothetical protein